MDYSHSISEQLFESMVIKMEGNHPKIIAGGLDLELEKTSDISLRLIDEEIHPLVLVAGNSDRVY